MDSATGCFDAPQEVREVFYGVDAESGVGNAEVGAFGEGGGIKGFEIWDEGAPPDA